MVQDEWIRRRNGTQVPHSISMMKRAKVPHSISMMKCDHVAFNFQEGGGFPDDEVEEVHARSAHALFAWIEVRAIIFCVLSSCRKRQRMASRSSDFTQCHPRN